MEHIRKIALAYSGGLDTSVIIPWLKDTYPGVEVYGICVNVGQDEDWDYIVKRGIDSGASEVYVCDVREEFVSEYIFPMLRSGAIYEQKYLLGTSIARPVQVKCQVEYAKKIGADALAHGCTGKGNDQVRFELSYRALAPELPIIAPWRMWDINSREQAIKYAREKNIPLGDSIKKSIYSRDENIWHTSHEGGILENTWNTPDESMYLRTKSPTQAPDMAQELVLGFEKSKPTELNGEKINFLQLLEKLNHMAGEHAIGRTDIVETRLVGMKSRGVYETPAGTVLYAALRELEMITLDKDTLAMKNTLAIKYAEEVYNGKWFNHFRAAMDAYMVECAKYVTGEVKLSLYKGSIQILGRKSPYSLYVEEIASFGESSYNHKDAGGFISLYGLNTGVQAMVRTSNMVDSTEQTQRLREMAHFSKK